MATAKKLPSGSWRVRVYVGRNDDGKPVYKSFTGSDKRKVEKEAAAYAEEHRCATETKTFGAAVEEYINSKSNILSPTTIDGYMKIIRNHFDCLRDIPVDRITNATLQTFVNDLSGKLSPKSVSNIYGLAVSVIYGVDSSKRFSVSLPKKQKVYRDLPSPADVIRAVKGTDIELAAMLALWLSLRMSEVRGLRQSDISPDNILTINNVRVWTHQGDILKSEAKTYDSKRRFRLPPYIRDLIDKTETEFLVPYTACSITTRFQNALKAANVPRIRFHDLRHLNASVMLQLGIPDKYAMERGGWASPNVMKGIYQHTFSAERLETDRKIDDYFTAMCHEI